MGHQSAPPRPRPFCFHVILKASPQHSLHVSGKNESSPKTWNHAPPYALSAVDVIFCFQCFWPLGHCTVSGKKQNKKQNRKRERCFTWFSGPHIKMDVTVGALHWLKLKQKQDKRIKLRVPLLWPITCDIPTSMRILSIYSREGTQNSSIGFYSCTVDSSMRLGAPRIGCSGGIS